MLTFGLLDLSSDSTYVAFEPFATPALHATAAAILSLPIGLVAVAFWAIITIRYV